MTLSSSELERYARHIVLADIGGPGQQKLKQASVLIVGAGGLGSPVIQYLAASGVGRIGIIDNDTISLSNLQRQIIHDTNAIGKMKVESAKDAINRINPHVLVSVFEDRLSANNIFKVIDDFDIVVDGSDNFATRYLVSDACFFAKKTLVSGAVGQLDGSITTLKPFTLNEEQKPNPTYRCLFPEIPAEDSVPSCETAGVLGALTGVIGSMQALEVVKEIVGFGVGLTGRLLLYDARNTRFEVIQYQWNKKNPLNGESPVKFDELWDSQ